MIKFEITIIFNGVSDLLTIIFKNMYNVRSFKVTYSKIICAPHQISVMQKCEKLISKFAIIISGKLQLLSRIFVAFALFLNL